MGKSSKRRRRREQLDKLRGVSSDSTTVLGNSPNPANADHLRNYGKPGPSLASNEIEETPEMKPVKKKQVVVWPSEKAALPLMSKSSQRKQVELVFPRKNKQVPEPFSFRMHQTGRNTELPPIQEVEEEHDGSPRKPDESIHDILYPKRKRLEGTFEQIQQESGMRNPNQQTQPSGSSSGKKKRKKKRKRGGSIEKEKQETAEMAKVMGPVVLFSKPRITETLPTKPAVKPTKESPASTSRAEATRTVKRPENNSVEPPKESQHATSPTQIPNPRDDKKKSLETRESVDRSSSSSLVQEVSMYRGQLSGRSVEEAVKDKRGLRPRANSTDGELNLPQGGLCDERMVLETYQWKDRDNYVHQVTPKGFVNVGNTCFLNAMLQCLAHCPPFCQTLIALSELRSNRQRNQKISKGQRITAFLSILFQRVHGFHGNAAHGGAIAPKEIVKMLPTLGSGGSRNGYKFRPGRQEDTHEFLVHLLDAMHDGELRGAGINQHISGWRDRLPVLRLDETTFVHRIFGGYFRSQVKCGRCGYCSNTYDPFLDLSLEVNRRASNSVCYALQEFTRKETLDSENKWKCSGCNKRVCATKQLTVFRPPLSLCIQLKRFAFNGGGFGLSTFSAYGASKWKYGKNNHAFRGGSKISKPIEFPCELSLPLSDKRSCEYRLTGVVVHVGGTASSGHYTAYISKPGRKGLHQWFHADDSFVEAVPERKVLREKDAYVLFYTRKEVKLEFPSPPRRSLSTEQAKEFGKARARARADSISHQENSNKDAVGDRERNRENHKDVRADRPVAAPKGMGVSSKSLPEFLNERFSGTVNGRVRKEPTNTKTTIPSEPESSQTALPVHQKSSSDSDTDSTDDKSSEEERQEQQPKTSKSPSDLVEMSNSNPRSTKVVVKTAGVRGKIALMLGPKKRKAWKSKATAVGSKKDEGFDLLGNREISRWDDESPDKPQELSSKKKFAVSDQRRKVVNRMNRDEQTRKRKMHLDRWDYSLDQGRTKKVKTNPTPDQLPIGQKNVFQRIQNGMQKMRKGKPKGFHRRKK